MRIMIADSHPEVRAALRLLLEEQAATWIVASEAGNAIELINRVRSANPRVILIDWDLPGMRVAQAGAGLQRADKIFLAISAISPKAKILVLSTNPAARFPGTERRPRLGVCLRICTPLAEDRLCSGVAPKFMVLVRRPAP